MSLLEVLPHPIDLRKYTSLAEHQSRTPSSFYDAPPILHFHAENCKIQITNDLLAAEGPLQAVFGPPPAHILNSPPKIPVQINFEGVHVIAASDAFLFSSPIGHKTLSIPYPLITLHAIQHSPSLSSPTSKLFSIYLQISPAPSSEDDDPLELIITPHLSIHKSPTTQISNSSDAMAMDTTCGSKTSHSQESLTKAMFDALTCCADLHPTNSSGAMGFFDDEDDEEDYGTDDEQDDTIAFEGPVGYGDEMDVDHAFTRIKKKSSKGIGSAGMPGDGGWITSENVHLLEKVKVEGGLGPGAGSVRPRDDGDEEEEHDSGPANGDGHLNGGKEGTEAKWRRTG
ncbi:hypothetical protein L211DRAFT_871923 [Terfezia boudieri ATCC MYA-4762]|uniref:Regulator of volume decrease after cellular swelling-domain-containing protein n=1 Tax=Terfezia boudieri ATCC MYA-4762 TaxID=1051890 RepID=A0A3N4LJE0_9PEZI|nr:hypothetical protein L211DRAFT_871923 [Terfezia boudieri ATCC MYA-4762]